MIAKAKAISHGINDIRYITGESHNKKHPEKIYRILDNMMPSEPDAMGVWNSMQFTLSRFRPVKNSVIRIELSPSPEHTKDFTIEDWQKLWQDFATEFDKQVFKDKDGKARNCPTNLANSKYTVWLHMESNSGVPHNPIAEFLIFMLLSAGWMKTDRSTTTTIYTFVPNGQRKKWQRNVDGRQQNR